MREGVAEIPKIKALSIPIDFMDAAGQANEWRVLHVFETACNLVGESEKVLSLVVPQVGNGPFNIVLPLGDFRTLADEQTRVAVSPDEIQIGMQRITLGGAHKWNAHPDWGKLRGEKNLQHLAADALDALIAAEAVPESFAHLLARTSPDTHPLSPVKQTAAGAISILMGALDSLQLPALSQAARQLAGLGGGLTPAGDDLILGVMHGLWASLSDGDARRCCRALTADLQTRTTSLSSAWLHAAAEGKAGEPWHAMVRAIGSARSEKIISAAQAILSSGHSSGADALGGFAATLRRLAA